MVSHKINPITTETFKKEKDHSKESDASKTTKKKNNGEMRYIK